jgi:hypothetical protein
MSFLRGKIIIIIIIIKLCGNCHAIDVIICSMNDVHCITCCSKSKVHKSIFLRCLITTNDGPILSTIEGKWLEPIRHMTKFEFLNLAHLKQV